MTVIVGNIQIGTSDPEYGMEISARQKADGWLECNPNESPIRHEYSVIRETERGTFIVHDPAPEVFL